MAVAVMPGALMPILAAGGNEAVQQLRQIVFQAGFEFDGADRRGTADDEERDHAQCHPGMPYHLGDPRGNIVISRWPAVVTLNCC